MKIPELLSPVGNVEHLKIAVLAGASSVYLSGTNYGARKYADNFTIEEISKSVEYAHMHNVKVYITVNTLIKEEELGDCLKYVYELYSLGVDAVLIQDIGLMKLIHEFIPDLNIHASTQMNIENINDLKWAKKSGISRVVLPRELTLNELKNMTQEAHKIGLEVEFFVHGAQCYSYSGRCLFSSFIGGRSGNRGTCAQPCRQAYTLTADSCNGNFYKLGNNDGKYYLSPKDLSLYGKLDVLTDVGVDCLKIEGRMRNKEYVMITTSTYRQSLNKLRRKSKDKEFTSQKGHEDLSLVFNRKLSTGHLFNNKDSNKIMNINNPGHIGLYIGKIQEFDNESGKFFIQLNENLIHIPQKGDGLVIEGTPLKKDSKTHTYGFDISGNPNFKKSKAYWKKNRLIKEKVEGKVLIVQKVRENKKPYIKIEKGCKVYLNKRNSVNKTLKELEHDSHSQGFRKSTLHMKFSVDKENYPIIKGTVKLSNGELIKVKQKGLKPWETAKNRPINEKTIEKQISKISDLPYYLETVEVARINRNLFTPISDLNQLRRSFFEKVEEKILSNYIPKNRDLKNSKEKIEKYVKKEDQIRIDTVTLDKNLNVYLNNLTVLENLKENIFDNVYFDIPTKNNKLIDEHKSLDISYCVNIIKDATRICAEKNCNFIWMWPSIVHDELFEDLIKVCGILSKVSTVPSIMISNLGIGEYLKDKFKIEVYGAYPLNISNSESVKKLNNFKLLTVSPELGKKDFKNIFRTYEEDFPVLELLIHGNIESLISRKNILPHDIKNSLKKLDNPNNEINNVYLNDKNKNKYSLYRPLNEEGVMMLNYQDLCLINEVDFLKEIGVSNFSIDARWKNIDYVNNIGEIYKDVIDNGNVSKNILNNIKKYSPNISCGNFTRGF